jgi:glycosyltransferase involved in cell wall biosynthesis
VNSIKKLKVMFVHEVSYEAKVVFEMHEFPELLALQGHEVLFLDYPEHDHHYFGRKVEEKICQGRAFPQAAIRLKSIPNFWKQPLGRVLAFFIGFPLIKRYVSREKPDIVILYGVPTNGVQTIRAARKLGIPVVHRAIDVSHLLRPGILSKLVPITEKYVFNKSDLVLANNAALAEYISQKCDKHQNIQVLAPGVKQVKKSREDRQQPEFDFVFMGTLFRFSGLAWVIRSLANDAGLEDKTLLIIGAGEAESSLRQLVQQLEITDRVIFTGQVNFASLQHHVMRGRVALLPFDESKIARLALPGKVSQYLTFGLPTVSTRLDGLMSYLPETMGVLYAQPGEDFMKLANSLSYDEPRMTQIVEAGQIRLGEVADWDNVIQKLEEIMLSVLHQNQKL